MKFLNVHLSTENSQAERFDTLVSPSGTVATLNQIAHENGVDQMAYDSAFPDAVSVKDAIFEEVENCLNKDVLPVVLFTTLVYNAEHTLNFASRLRSEYQQRVRIVLGGQLVPFATKAYLKNENIDSVCVGDGEVLIPQLIKDIRAGCEQKFYSSWLAQDSERKGKFVSVNYDNYYQLKERLIEQKKVCGFSRICVQGPGGPGCSWAANNKNGACDFCALQNITEMNSTSLFEMLRVEKDLQNKFDPDYFFDVANQFLPFANKRKNLFWLQNYIKERSRAGVTIPKYTYLTVASVDEDIAPLLKEAGIEEVYLGVDHFDALALKQQNKSHLTVSRLERTLKILRANKITARIGLVVGSAPESESSLRNLQEGVELLVANYLDVVKAIGIFPIYVLPGSKVYTRAKNMPLANRIIESFEAKGYFSDQETLDLSRIYMNEFSSVSSDEIFAVIADLRRRLDQVMLAYDYRNSPGSEKMKMVRG